MKSRTSLLRNLLPGPLASLAPLLLAAAFSSCSGSNLAPPLRHVSADGSTIIPALSVLIAANGSSKVDILVSIVDEAGLAMPGVKVTLVSESEGVEFTQPAAPTDANGLAGGSVSSTLEGLKIIRAVAEIGTQSILLKHVASVRFYAPGPCSTNSISPVGVTNTYTGMTTPDPWGASSGRIYQQIHDDMIGVSGVIKAMAFRHKFDRGYAAKSYDASLIVGDAAGKAAAMQDEFAKNWLDGGSRTQTFSGKIDFPVLIPHPFAPASFTATISFTQPVYHAGVQPLLWEADIRPLSLTSAGPEFEAGPGSAGTGSASHRAGVLGKGCTATGQSGPLTSKGSTSYTNNSKGSFDETLLNGPASGVTVLAVGDTSDSTMGMPLPMRLTFVGSPSCFLYINFVTYLPTTTRTSHHFDFVYPPSLSGRRFRTQWATDDGGICKTSNGLEHSYPYTPATWPSRSLIAPASEPPPVKGTVAQHGLVVQFCM